MTYLNPAIEKQIDELIAKMTPDEKVSQLTGNTSFTTADNFRLGIPGIVFDDGPNGVRYNFADVPDQKPPIQIGGPATCFPVRVAMSATWDTDILRELGWIMGREFSAYSINQPLGPTLDIERDPRNGRAAETGGEDPYLVSTTTPAIIRGIQSNSVIATCKHYLGYGRQTGQKTNNYSIAPRALREFHSSSGMFSIFESNIKSIMTQYSWVNGYPASGNKSILTTMLRDEFGYLFYVISDWISLYGTAAESINAGLDLEMPNNQVFSDPKIGIMACLKNGTLTMPTLDKSVRRVLRTKFITPIKKTPIDLSMINTPLANRINLETSLKAMVLLKNKNNILPFSKNIKKLALIGPNAIRLVYNSNGSSEVTPAYIIEPRQGMNIVVPNTEILLTKGCDINSTDISGFPEALAFAKDADAVVFIGGLDKTQEGEGIPTRERTSGNIQLPGEQQNLIVALSKVNPNLVVVIQSGGICSVADSIDNIPALIYAWYSGNLAGLSIAQTIFGDYNPGGKLPVTMPYRDYQLPSQEDYNYDRDMIDTVGYRRFDAFELIPIFPFGFGISYTTFEYSNLKYPKTVSGTNLPKITFDVKNTGSVIGDEVAQLYLTYKSYPVEMAPKQLKGFKRITLKPGETKNVTLILRPYDLAYWEDKSSHFLVPKSTLGIMVGGSSDNLVLSGEMTITSDYIIPYGYQLFQVYVNSPVGYEVYNCKMTVNWSSYNPKNFNLTYTLEILKAGIWTTLVTNYKGTSFDVSLKDYPRGFSKVRVSATNGEYVSEDLSGSFHIGPLATNVALFKPVTASSIESSNFPASNITNGYYINRWASEHFTPQWVVIDLQSLYEVERINIYWEYAYATIYKIESSLDTISWTTIKEENKGRGGVEISLFSRVTARYIRIYCLERALPYGYSIHQVEVFALEAPLAKLNLAQDGKGEIIVSPPPPYPPGTIVHIEAKPSAGWKLETWTGDIDGNIPFQLLQLDVNKSAMAIFTPITNVTLATFVQGNGSIVLDPPGSTYPIKTIVKVSIIGDNFKYWSGDLSGSNPEQFISLDTSKIVTATFQDVTVCQ